jgi:hypothetical protein
MRCYPTMSEVPLSMNALGLPVCIDRLAGPARRTRPAFS